MDLSSLVLDQPDTRRIFDNDFKRLHVDCFCLFAEDSWQRGNYILHEHDTHVYYPETFYAGISPQRFASIEERLVLEQQSDLRTYFTDSPTGLGVASTFVERIGDTHHQQFERLFAAFAVREGIRSCAVFSPPQAKFANLRVPEMLFLNFRTDAGLELDSNQTLRDELTLLATRVMRAAAHVHEARQHRWRPALHRAINAYTEIVSAVCEDADRHSPVNPGSNFYEAILKDLLHIIRPARDRVDVREIASLQLVEEDEENVFLRRKCEYPVGKYAEREQLLYGGLSITCLTVLTERCHVLNYVDREGASSVLLPANIAVEFLTNSDQLPQGMKLIHDVLQSVSGPNHCLHRLEFSGNSITESFAALSNTDLGKRHSWLVEKLLARVKCGYAQIFKPLLDNWRRPCSELTIPILVGGQAIGCINIESEQPYRWIPSSVSTLSFLGRVIGSAIARGMDASIVDAARKCATSLAFGQSVHRERQSLDEFAKGVQGSIQCKRVHFMRSDQVIDSAKLDSATVQPTRALTQFIPVYDRLASSMRGWRNDPKVTAPPRKTGWTRRVAEDPDPSCIGYLFELDKQIDPKYPRPTQAWRICRDGSKFRYNRIPDTEIASNPINADDSALDCRYFTAIRLEERASGQIRAIHRDEKQSIEPQSPASAHIAVMWIAHRRSGCINVQKWKIGQEFTVHMAEYLSRLSAVADTCSIVSTGLRPRRREYERLLALLRHGHVNQLLMSAANSIQFALDDLDKDINVIRSRLSNAHLLIRYVEHHIESFVGHTDTVGGMELSAAMVEERRGPINLKSVVDECWQVATQIYTRKSTEFRNYIDPQLVVLVLDSYIRAMLVAVLTNCLEHGKSSDGVVQVTVECQAWDPELYPENIAKAGEQMNVVELKVSDTGCEQRPLPTIEGTRGDIDRALIQGGLGTIVAFRLGRILSPVGDAPKLSPRCDSPGTTFTATLLAEMR